MAIKQRVELLEHVLKPESKAQVKHFCTRNYLSEEEMQADMKRWRKLNPRQAGAPRNIIVEHRSGWKPELEVIKND